MALSHRAELLGRNLGLLAGERRLFVDFEVDDLLELARDGLPLAGAELVEHHYGGLRRARMPGAAGARIPVVHFGLAEIPAGERYALIVLSLPQGREARDMVFAMVAALLAPGGRLLVVGETRAGIRPARADLTERFARVEALDSARRCALLSADQPREAPAGLDAVLKQHFRVDAFSVGGVEVQVASLPGVFSHGELDEGTRDLLATLGEVQARRILDVGCGAGVIGAALHARQADRHIDMVDVSAWALASARRTAELNGMPVERVFASDVYSDVRDMYDLIVSNPPFHRGIDTDWSVVERFLTQARDHLTPGGAVRFVANSHLAYADLLNRSFGRWDIVDETERFIIYEATA